MLNSEFNELCKTEDQKKLDLYPVHLRAEIDALNSWIFPYVKNILSNIILTAIWMLIFSHLFLQGNLS